MRRTDADLFAVLEAVVATGGPAGFSGTIAVGILSKRGSARWWIATFSTRTKTRVTEAAPSFDAAIGLDEQAARALGGRKSAPEHALAIKAGDMRLLQRFFDRYFRPQNFIAVRCGTSAKE